MYLLLSYFEKKLDWEHAKPFKGRSTWFYFNLKGILLDTCHIHIFIHILRNHVLGIFRTPYLTLKGLVSIFHVLKVRINCHFLNNIHTLLCLRNIWMVPYVTLFGFLHSKAFFRAFFPFLKGPFFLHATLIDFENYHAESFLIKLSYSLKIVDTYLLVNWITKAVTK